MWFKGYDFDRPLLSNFSLEMPLFVWDSFLTSSGAIMEVPIDWFKCIGRFVSTKCVLSILRKKINNNVYEMVNKFVSWRFQSLTIYVLFSVLTASDIFMWQLGNYCSSINLVASISLILINYFLLKRCMFNLFFYAFSEQLFLALHHYSQLYNYDNQHSQKSFDLHQCHHPHIVFLIGFCFEICFRP